MRAKGVRHDLINAVYSVLVGGLLEDDLVRLIARIKALANFLGTDDGSNLLVAYRRASNIVAIESGGWKRGEINPSLLRQPEEKTLTDRLAEIGALARRALEQEDFEHAMTGLAALRQPVDEFFEKVTVNTDEPKLRENRLRLLSRIRETIDQVADFSQIEG